MEALFENLKGHGLPLRGAFSLLGALLLASTPCFAGITSLGAVPSAVGPQSSQSMYACAQNCQPGDEKCLQTCVKLKPPQQQPLPANFQCVNQCTRAGYAYGYCKTLCSN